MPSRTPAGGQFDGSMNCQRSLVDGRVGHVVTTPQDRIPADAYRIAHEAAPLTCELSAAVAVCVSDDTQGVGGLLHLRFVPHNQSKPLDLTDNTLSTDLLLLDRFCKDLRAQGARKQSWRVRLVCHIPTQDGMETPAATLFDLLRAYFADSRFPPECKEVRRPGAVLVRLDPREGQVTLHAAGDDVVRAGTSAAK